jgi:hypothetical protein
MGWALLLRPLVNTIGFGAALLTAIPGPEQIKTGLRFGADWLHAHFATGTYDEWQRGAAGHRGILISDGTLSRSSWNGTVD